MPAYRRDQVEEACQPVLVALGYNGRLPADDQTLPSVAIGRGEKYWRPPSSLRHSRKEADVDEGDEEEEEEEEDVEDEDDDDDDEEENATGEPVRRTIIPVPAKPGNGSTGEAGGGGAVRGAVGA